MTWTNTPARALAGLMLTLLAAPWAAAQNRDLGSRGELLDGIAAVVDEGVVLKSELDMRVQLVMDNFMREQSQVPANQRAQLPPMSVLREQVLEQLILKEIQLQRAERIGIVIGDDILNQALSQVAEGNNMTLDDLPAVMARDGIDYNQYRLDTREEIILGQLEQRDLNARIRIAPRELDQCLERLDATQTQEYDYNISHILIGLPANASRDELRAAADEADEVFGRITDGADFGEMALTYSDSDTALSSGQLGWRKGAELPTMFAQVVPVLEVGETSEPIQTGSGYHLVRLNDMRGAERIMVDQVRARHILLAPNELLDSDATRQKLLGIYQQIVDGEDFATLAIASSEDAGSAVDGGDLGWAEASAYVDEFSEVINNAEIGELIPPFETRFGWHILEVLERRSYDTTDERKELRCAQEIRSSKLVEEREMWLRQIRDESYVDIRP